MPHLKFIPLLLFMALSLCAAEPRIWTSTSGSEIEATYLGSFGYDLWFEGTDPQKRLLKMPAKYISAHDLSRIEIKEIRPLIPPQSIDSDEASISLLEQLLVTKVPEPIESTLALKDALNDPIDTIPQDEDAAIIIKFHRKVDKDATRAAPIQEPTVYACLQLLAEAHELNWSIRKGTLTLRPR